ncbi:hypothetical protein [Enterococcus faecalis]|uniref:hypothetical protein n=1 Tax=Enterococcus TaxID=1350 RepID=UPI00070D78FC|nr:hypothetical protein [Enterococcus faecalis]KXF71026.1 hypothetical protein AQ486_03785 [Enterococcus faecalis]KXF74443.1 hypothetical protein AQ487_01315 [Enterococcus faecalis]MBC2813743.1 hypothetical protein [Enterococcus faecalis]MBC2817920.1 hypothetical protein [Enterococcus faecalis]MBC2821524.1 hypothetical protein [Enterococcus faecalis]
MEKSKSLIIWLPTGETMKFEDVRHVETVTTDLEWDVLKFNYPGVSTGVRRNVVFEMSKLMGWALEE